jgi:hypothetical protein
MTVFPMRSMANLDRGLGTRTVCSAVASNIKFGELAMEEGRRLALDHSPGTRAGKLCNGSKQFCVATSRLNSLCRNLRSDFAKRGHLLVSRPAQLRSATFP